MSTVARIIARTLATAGVRYVFGHPGGEVAHLLESLRQEGISFVLTRHEATAAYLAASWGELSGQPGVCLSTLGPGATNLLSGVAHGYLDRCPMIAITAQLATDREIRATHQRLDVPAMFAPVTKASIRVASDTAATAIEHALYLASAERPGPVHVEIPSNVAGQEFQGTSRTTRPARVQSRPSVHGATDLVARAKRPAILAGLGAVRSGATSGLIQLAEALGAPVVTTPKAKGVIPEDHPLAAGVLDMTGEEVVNSLLREADLLITAGLDVVELIRPWGFRAPVLHLDSLPNLDQLYPADLEVVGDVGGALEDLAAAIAAPSEWSAGRLAEHRACLQAALLPRCAGLAPHTVLRAARAALPRHGIVASDVGAHKILMGQVWTAYEPRAYLVSNGLSAMGTSVPAALAAKLLWPDRPALAIVGDGGLGMYLGEIETAVRLGVDLPIIVLVDGSLSLIRLGQGQRGYPAYGVDFTRSRLAELAGCLGAHGTRVTTESETRAALDQALERKGVTLIEAIIDASAYGGGE